MRLRAVRPRCAGLANPRDAAVFDHDIRAAPVREPRVFENRRRHARDFMQ